MYKVHYEHTRESAVKLCGTQNPTDADVEAFISISRCRSLVAEDPFHLAKMVEKWAKAGYTVTKVEKM